MFKSLQLLNLEVINEGFRVTFNIQDTCFQQSIEIISHTGISENCEPVAITKVYNDRNLNVARNLAIYYLLLTKDNSHTYALVLLAQDRDFMDSYFSFLNYGKKYYPLVKQRMFQLKMQ